MQADHLSQHVGAVAEIRPMPRTDIQPNNGADSHGDNSFDTLCESVTILTKPIPFALSNSSIFGVTKRRFLEKTSTLSGRIDPLQMQSPAGMAN